MKTRSIKWLLVSAILLCITITSTVLLNTDNNKQVVKISQQNPTELLSQLIKLDNKAEIFNQLQMLKQAVERDRLALHQDHSYHPDFLFTAISLRYALAHLPDTLDEVTDCLRIISAIEYDERTPIEEFEQPIPTLGLVIEKLCVEG